jgi:hypothetical protein
VEPGVEANGHCGGRKHEAPAEAESSCGRPPALQEDRERKGISLKDVLCIFPGATVMKQQLCNQCLLNSRKRIAKGEDVPMWRRGGRIVERVWPNGVCELPCHFCGRRIQGGHR